MSGLPYSTFGDFGSAMNPNVLNPLDQSNPLSYCITPTYNSQFLHGSTSTNLLYTPYGPGCANYMAERCSKTYDGYCRAYNTLNNDTSWPNLAAIDNLTFGIAKSFLKIKTTSGQNMIRNAAERKYLEYPNVASKAEPFDPNVANSPLVTTYTSSYNPGYVRYKNLNNPAAIDNDYLMDAVIEEWPACFDVLTKIYRGYKNKDPNIRLYPSRFELFLKEKAGLFDEFLCFLKTVPNYPSDDYDTGDFCSSNQCFSKF